MKTIGASIADGAMAFLRAEYRILGVFVVAVAFVLGFANSGRADSSAFIALSFIIGAVASGFAGIPRYESSNKGKQSYNSCCRNKLG